eukprot:1358413-Rhodomonas_salina.1
MNTSACVCVGHTRQCAYHHSGQLPSLVHTAVLLLYASVCIPLCVWPTHQLPRNQYQLPNTRGSVRYELGLRARGAYRGEYEDKEEDA